MLYLPGFLKRCNLCGEPKLPSEFHKSSASKDGLNARCKTCRNAFHAQYRLTHAQAISEGKKSWYKKNVESVKARVKNNRLKDIEADRVRSNNYKQQHREEMRIYQRRYNQFYYPKNKDKYTVWARNRRARKLAAEGSHNSKDILAQYKRQNGCCYYCGEKVGDTYHVDHIIPVSRGGSNSPENLVITCADCNLHKSNKLPHEWPEGGHLL